MKKSIVVAVLLPTAAAFAQDSALTLYNQNFAVVRERIELDLREGENQVVFSGITAYAEPDSVILRDFSGQNSLRILEQNYRADPVTQDLLLAHFTGAEIEFLSDTNIVKGKIIRAGNMTSAPYNLREQPIIEVDGQLRFSLPGEPLFPALADDSILKPTFNWSLHSDQAGKTDAELCYISGGLTWEADYNIIAPEQGGEVDLIGWITMENHSGRTFENAGIKLMAGDVEKIAPTPSSRVVAKLKAPRMGFSAEFEPPVSEKTFDEYHLYELSRSTTLRDRETKQVEFLRATGVESKTVYIYDGAQIDHNRYHHWSYERIRHEREYGTESQPKVWVMREFRNTKENGLGIPLPKGRARFYRCNSDGQFEFTGENVIDHTPRDESVSIFTGNAFDLVGERNRMYFDINTSENWLDEAFEIKLRNRKENEAVQIRVVEHLYRALGWQITEQSDPHLKTDSKTVEFRVDVAPGEEKVITYKVRYNW
jgi:hypothetical protein